VENVNTAGASDSVGGQAPPGASRLKQGDRIGSRFVVEERTRASVPGDVYRAIDEKTGKKIALLLMQTDFTRGRPTQGLRRRVRAATGLAHKNIATTYGMGKEGRRRYVASELVEGQTLADLLEKKSDAGKHFTLKGAYNLIAHVCNALQYAGSKMPHGLLRPSAILINRTGRVKLSEFGLASLRPAVLRAIDGLGRWDAPCFPPSEAFDGEAPSIEDDADPSHGSMEDPNASADMSQEMSAASLMGSDAPTTEAVDTLPGDGTGDDDLRALGYILYSLLTGTPAESARPTLPEDALKRLPPGIDAVLARCFTHEESERYRDPNALKTELLAVIESGRGEKDKQPEPGVAPPPFAAAGGTGASIEALDGGQAAPTPPGKAASRRGQPAAPAPAVPKGDGGFVIPELTPAAGPEDDGNTERWLVERGGIDYGPYTSTQIFGQLDEDEITPETTLYDIETDDRRPLCEFPFFEEKLAVWAREQADRRKRREEEARAAAARRRARAVGGMVAAVLLVALVGGGGYAAWLATRPSPVKARLGTAVAKLQGALPMIRLPEVAPETAAERQERRDRAATANARRRAAAERAQIEREARLAASSSMDIDPDGPGTGRAFDLGELQRTIGTRNGRLSNCLQQEARRQPERNGVTVKVTVIPRGDIINVKVPEGTGAAKSCVRAALSGLKVTPFDGTNRTVSLPYSWK
jgi:serine/threonine protein kinase